MLKNQVDCRFSVSIRFRRKYPSMVLLQGLIFGRALMDSLARHGAHPAASALRQSHSIRGRRRINCRVSRANPYETSELLARVGGNSIRHLSKHADSASQLPIKSLENEAWWVDTLVQNKPWIILIDIYLRRRQMLITACCLVYKCSSFASLQYCLHLSVLCLFCAFGVCLHDIAIGIVTHTEIVRFRNKHHASVQNSLAERLNG